MEKKHGIQKIEYSHIFYFYNKEGEIRRACPATKNESIEAAKEYMRQFPDLRRCEKRTEITHEIVEFYDKGNEEWFK